jgi:hypothetical protein
LIFTRRTELTTLGSSNITESTNRTLLAALLPCSILVVASVTFDAQLQSSVEVGSSAASKTFYGSNLSSSSESRLAGSAYCRSGIRRVGIFLTKRT